ncbi:hypothetical protein [Sorangium sp. So ce1153]|uniref:hypothetical protein n=1 Tax=Sorangium sp. So ce1153 TaxID=3133333 RepID=UPI003F625F69
MRDRSANQLARGLFNNSHGARALLLAVAAAAAACAPDLRVGDEVVSLEPCTPRQTRACYSGPEGTEGEGACAAGVQACNDAGTGWGACEGEVLPAEEACNLADDDCDGAVDDGNPEGGAPCETGEPGVCSAGTATCTAGEITCPPATPASVEQCGTAADESCDGRASCEGAHVWSRAFGDLDLDRSHGVAVDGAGNVLIAGSFVGTIGGDGQSITSGGLRDAFVAKLDPIGALLWIKRFGGRDEDAATAIAVDGAGDVLVLFQTTGAITLGGEPIAGPYIAAKLAADGKHRWIKPFAGGSLAVDAGGNILVAGSFSGTVDYGKGPLVSTDGLDAFVAKYDPEGNILWNRAFGGRNEQQARDVAADSRGNVLVAGDFNVEIDFGDGLNETVFLTNFVVKLDPEGGNLWEHECPCPGGDGASWKSVAVDANDHIALTGYSDNANNNDVLVAKLDAEGNELWSRYIDGIVDEPGDSAGPQEGEQIAVDPVGNLLLTGWSSSKINLGDEPVPRGTFVGKLDPDGNAIWTKNLGSVTNIAVAVASDRLGNVLLSGHFGESVDLGGNRLTSAGSLDAFVAKLTP